MEKLLSIVIPVYKVEKFIDKCISSLLVPDKQQLQLLDIVVINDGTPDNSAILAKAYEKQYPGIVRVIDQENRGHGGAWNHGTELAIGKYLFYLDSDDIVRMYHLLPFPLYYAWFKCYYFYQRVIHFLKRKLKSLKH